MILRRWKLMFEAPTTPPARHTLEHFRSAPGAGAAHGDGVGPLGHHRSGARLRASPDSSTTPSSTPLPAIAQGLPRQPRRPSVGDAAYLLTLGSLRKSSVPSATCLAGGINRDRAGDRLRGHLVGQRRCAVDRDAHRGSGCKGITAALLIPSLAIISRLVSADGSGARSAPGRLPLVSPRQSARSSADSSSTPSRGGAVFSSACTWSRSRSSSRPGTCPGDGQDETADRRVDVLGGAVTRRGLAGAVAR